MFWMLLCAAACTTIAIARAQPTGGPPPEIRALIEAFVAGANGTPAQWEAMAKERFAPGYLKKTTEESRAAMHARIKKEFGTVTRDRVMREGPDAPLELNIKGSTGAAGVIRLSIEADSPYRITSIEIAPAGKREPPRDDGFPPPPIDARMTSGQLSQALHAYLSKLAADDVFSGAALVAREGRAIFERAYGFADRANRIPNTTATRFNLGSINKTFTQAAIAQLIGEGKVARTDTLGKFFPDHPQEVSRSATIDQLLRHTAGISDFFGDEFARAAKDRFRSNADYFRFVSTLPALFAPGTRNQYCNGCYIALGAIIERASGMPYEKYMQERIFGPAGMTRTGYPQSDAIEPNVALGYTRRGGEGSLRSNVFSHGAAGSAAGGGYSTVSDLLAYENALRANALSSESAAAILGAGGTSPAGRRSGGLGIAGGAPGTNAVFEADGTWTVILLSNLDPPAGERLGLAIMKALSPDR
jgi:CubicO group peptidase (beta-lactamase class C family)